MEMLQVDAGIHVDWLGREAHGLAGRIGMTHAPGVWRLGASRDEATRVRADLQALVDEHQASALVTLLDDADMNRFFEPSYLKRIRATALESIWFPIPDGEVPAGLDETVALVQRLLAEVAEGRTVVLHCLAGLGRAGTLAACCLIGSGRDASCAIDLVRAARPGTIQTAIQHLFVRRFARAWADAAAARP